MGREKDVAPDPATRQRLAVLVAHRDADMREALRMLLEDAGYAVRLSADPDAALAAARELTEAAIVLFEIEPAGVAGSGFLELALLRAAEREAGHAPPRLAFVALTTWPEQLPRTLKRLLRTLDVPLVAEPFELDELLRVVATAADRSDPAEQGGAVGATVAATAARAKATPKPRTRRTRT